MLLFAELFIMVVCCIAIIIIKLFTRWNARRNKKIKGQIADIINKELFSQGSLDNLDIPSNLLGFRNLVEELETFDNRFTDSRWVDIKRKIVEKYLLKRAENNTKSIFWLTRQLAARTFLLYPQKAGESILRSLLNDKKYLVRIVAAVTITKTQFKELFYEMIKVMSKETKLSQFPFRDALVDIDQDKFKWIESLLTTTTDPAIQAICIDILSTRVTNDLLPLLRPFLKSGNRECRVLAIKALGSIPSDESLDVLEDHLADSDWELRAISVEGLHKLHATRAIDKVRKLLNDPIWWVRLQAALTLKDFGDKGIEILRTQNSTANPEAYEIAQYTLALP
jgi:HEAT repeat protein